MNSNHLQKSDSASVLGGRVPRVRVGAMARSALAALLLFGGVAGALAQSIDALTRGNWIDTYGKCAYILSSPRVPVARETPILPGTQNCSPLSCPKGPGFPLVDPGQSYTGGASSDLQDCRGQTSPGGFVDAITYQVRLCSVPAGMPTNKAQGYVWQCFDGSQSGAQGFQSALQYPTDAKGAASCKPLTAQ